MVVLVETNSLEKLKDKLKDKLPPKSLREIRALCWEAHELFSVISRQHFKRCPSQELKNVKYATISYDEDTLWNTLDDFIFRGANNIEADFVFLDAFCINHCQNTAGRMEEMMQRRSEIFKHSNEHHIIGVDCLLHSENWFDLSYFDRRRRPILHDFNVDPEADHKLIEDIKKRGFDSVEVSDADTREKNMKEFVKQDIVRQWDTIEKFNDRVRDTVVKAVEVKMVILF